MRVYQLRHYEVMMPEENRNEARHLLCYEQICYDMLTIQAISFSRTIEIIQLNRWRIEHRPGKIHKILTAQKIPAFCFIVCKN